MSSEENSESVTPDEWSETLPVEEAGKTLNPSLTQNVQTNVQINRIESLQFLPSSLELERYERIKPGISQEFLEHMRREQAHRHEMNHKNVALKEEHLKSAIVQTKQDADNDYKIKLEKEKIRKRKVVYSYKL